MKLVEALTSVSLRRGGAVVVSLAVGLLMSTSNAWAGEEVPGSISDVRTTQDVMSVTLVLRGGKALTVDPSTVKATLGGQPAQVEVKPTARQERSTMLVVDTSGSMGASGMATVRAAVKDFLAVVPKDVKVGLVSFASTAGVDVAPTTDHRRVSREVASLKSRGETSLYDAIQAAVKGLGTKGERSIVLLSDGGDTVAALQGGAANESSELSAATNALKRAKVRAEVVAFKSPESNNKVLEQFAKAGGGSVANAAQDAEVSRAFRAAARALESQSLLTIKRPPGVAGDQPLVLSGSASGQPFRVTSAVDLGDTAPVVTPTTGPTVEAAPAPALGSVGSALDPKLLVPSVLLLTLGVFLFAVAFMGPVFRSRRAERVSAIDQYGFGRAPSGQQRQAPSTAALTAQLLNMGDRVMEKRESTTKTMRLLDRADLPWRAGEWFVLRIVAVVVAGALGFVVLKPLPWVGFLIGALVGFVGAPVALRFLAKRRSKKYEAQLPDVLMLVATSLASGFSLLQALDAVARDASEPASKEFSRALAEARIGADVSDALDHMAVRMDSQNMRWAVMAIRIQRDVGGNLAETLRTTAATLREREMLRRQVRALSAEGRLSAYILIALPLGLFLYMVWVNYDYISLLWTTLFGWMMLVGGCISLVIGMFWMRKVVKIEV